jgi:hypothetical protein
MTLPLAPVFLIGHDLVEGALVAGVAFAFPVVDEAEAFTLGLVLGFVEVAFVADEAFEPTLVFGAALALAVTLVFGVDFAFAAALDFEALPILDFEATLALGAALLAAFIGALAGFAATLTAAGLILGGTETGLAGLTLLELSFGVTALTFRSTKGTPLAKSNAQHRTSSERIRVRRMLADVLQMRVSEGRKLGNLENVVDPVDERSTRRIRRWK